MMMTFSMERDIFLGTRRLPLPAPLQGFPYARTVAGGMSAQTSQTSQPVQPTPAIFRLRALLILISYLVGFWLGTVLQDALFNDDRPTAVLIGRWFGAGGANVMLWVAAGLTIAAWLIRWWASSYHFAGVVMNYTLVTETFTAEGPYRFVRNPLYVGNILMALGLGLLGPPIATLLVVAFNAIIVFALIRVEERGLRASIGAPYEEYCRRVGRLVPKFTRPDLPHGDRKANWVRGFFTEIWILGFAVATCYLAARADQARDIAMAFWIIAAGVVIAQFFRFSSREAPAAQGR
jgi:protein-S-isoprenylcysteine O-methyltransferase Ste14